MKLSLCRECFVEDDGNPGVTIITEAHGGWSSGWVAKVTGINPQAPGGLDRTFLEPFKNTLSRAGNGSKYYAIVEDGLYEADSVWRSYQAHRVAFRVKGGAIDVLADSAESSRGHVRNVLTAALKEGTDEPH